MHGRSRVARDQQELRRHRHAAAALHPCRRRQLHGRGRPLRLRQVDAAAPGRGAGAAGWRRHHHRRGRRHPPGAGPPRRRHGVPVLRAVSAHDGGGEHRLRPVGTRHAPGRDHAPHRAGGGGAADRRPVEPQAAPALRRAAPARRDGPRHGARAARVPVRRAALQPRCTAAHLHAHRVAAPAPRDRRHQPVRDARPGGGDDARRPADRHACRPRRAGRRGAGDLREARQPVRGELHRRAADEPAAGNAMRRAA